MLVIVFLCVVRGRDRLLWRGQRGVFGEDAEESGVGHTT